MKTKILSTLGPSSLNKDIVNQLAENGVDLFRINLSHTSLEDVEEVIRRVQSWTDVPICLDSEGAQVRNQNMISESVYFKVGDLVTIHHEAILGDSNNISFAPKNVSKQFKVDDLIRIDFNSAAIRVVEDKKNYLVANVEQGGHVGSNKAADVNRKIDLHPITSKDESAFRIGLDLGIEDFSLSFTNTADDVKKVREIIGSDNNLISKIESIEGVQNLADILPLVDQILIDRGDLSRQVPIEKIPFIQRGIITFSRSMETPVFVATNLLESMIKSSLPTRAEANDVASTLLMGASGLVLAAETAIGAYPVGAVKMINSIIKEYNQWSPDSSLNDIIYGAGNADS
jgi:pyruvate kinase